MRKSFKNFCFLTITIFFVSSSLFQAEAQAFIDPANPYLQVTEIPCEYAITNFNNTLPIIPYASYYIDTYFGDIEALGDSKLEICSFVSCGKNVSIINTTIQLQMKVGNNYVNVGSSTSKSSYNTHCNGFDLIYSGLVPNETYRAKITFTASDAKTETRYLTTVLETVY